MRALVIIVAIALVALAVAFVAHRRTISRRGGMPGGHLRLDLGGLHGGVLARGVGGSRYDLSIGDHRSRLASVEGGRPGDHDLEVSQIAADPATGAGAAGEPRPRGLSMRSRLLALVAGVSALFGTLLARLWGMQLIDSSSYAQKASANLTREVSTRAPRGRILDRNGNVLVGNRSGLALVATSTVADDVRVVRRISNLIGMPEVAVRRAIQSTTEGAQSLRTIMVDVPERAVAYVTEHPGQFPGVSVETRWLRSYPNGSLACHLLGYTGTISSDELAAYNADEANGGSYRTDDTVGKSGVELQYESVLQGIRGTRVVHVNASGTVTGVVSEVQPEQGSDIRLTIDVTTQRAAEHAILSGMEASRALDYAATGGAVVALDCKTGEVLALASYPNYNPAAFVGGIGSDLWARLQAPDAHTPLLNRAINGLYPPASTVKPMTALAGLEAGVCTEDSSYYCDGWWTGFGDASSGKWCWNHDGHKSIDLRRGIAESCDVVFYEIAKAVYYSGQPEAIQGMFRRWGLGAATGVDLPGESSGRVPDAQWKWNWFTSYSDADRSWQPGDTANIAIGQGDMLVTPMQLAYAFEGIAMNGTQMWPHVLKEVISSQTGETVTSVPARVARQVSVDQDDLSFIHGAMYAVINEVATMNLYFANVPVTVGGKSGTGEAGDDLTNPHAWFVAVAPMEDPQYVVASFIEHGGGGGDITTSVCAEVLASLYGNGPQDYIAINKERNVAPNTGEGAGA